MVRSIVFFPNLVSTVAVGIIFKALMHPSKGLFNEILGMAGISRVNWLGDRGAALYSVIAVDVWKGVGVATVIYIAGISAISKDYYEAASLDGATGWQQFWKNYSSPVPFFHELCYHSGIHRRNENFRPDLVHDWRRSWFCYRYHGVCYLQAVCCRFLWNVHCWKRNYVCAYRSNCFSTI
ncbi:MAG: carbohydrate ABC transporter permease [Blautia faecis]